VSCRCPPNIFITHSQSPDLESSLHYRSHHLFALLVENTLAKKEFPSGKNGYYFAENRFQSWVSIAERVGKAGYEIGLFDSLNVGRITLKEVADEFFARNLRDAEGVLASK
jgi:hypothetical protein